MYDEETKLIECSPSMVLPCNLVERDSNYQYAVVRKSMISFNILLRQRRDLINKYKNFQENYELKIKYFSFSSQKTMYRYHVKTYKPSFLTTFYL